MSDLTREQLIDFISQKYNGGAFQDRIELRKEIERTLKVKETRAREIVREIINQYDGEYFKPVDSLIKASNNYKKEVVTSSEINSLEKVIEHCNIDTNIWNIEKYAIEQGANDKEGNAQFRWKLNLEKKVSDFNEKIISDLKEDLKKNSKIVARKNYGKSNGFMLEIAIFDSHMGKLSFWGETNSNYDLKIAKQAYLDTLYDLLEKAKKFGTPEKILFIIGQDFINIDNNLLTTTAGTKQDVDGRYPKIVKEGREVLTHSIDILKEIAPVEVLVSPGNHDFNTMFHIGDSVECYYHNDENVTVNNQPISRKYVKYGKSLICLSHGDKIKADQIPLIMATECSKDWATTKYKFCFLGHYHTESMKEIRGVKIHYLSSISAPDLYHFDNGYVGNIRQAQAFIFDKENGLESILYSKPVES